MGTFGIEFRFPLDEPELHNLKALVDHPERGRDAYIDAGEIAVRVDGSVVLPPWRYVPHQSFTGYNWVRTTIRDFEQAVRQLRAGQASALVTFLDSPIAIEFHLTGFEVVLVVSSEVGPELSRTETAKTRVRLDVLATEVEDAERRYDACLAEIDPALPSICGFVRPP